MIKYARFEWTTVVKVPDDFDPDDHIQFTKALNDAWLNTHKSAGEFDDVFEEPDESAIKPAKSNST
jgi:hypothetical protein